MRKYGFPFTVFVSTDAVDQRLLAFMSWDQMKEMEGNGVSYANHGASHLSIIHRLNDESDEERIQRVLTDIEKGRSRLAAELPPIPSVFAYPYGEYDSKVADRLRTMGYICFGQHSGPVGPDSDRCALQRFAIAEAYADMSEFSVKVRSLPMPVVTLTPWEPVIEAGIPSIDVTLGESEAHLSDLTCFIGGQGRVAVQ